MNVDKIREDRLFQKSNGKGPQYTIVGFKTYKGRVFAKCFNHVNGENTVFPIDVLSTDRYVSIDEP